MLNSMKATPKKSSVEKSMSMQVIYIFIAQILFCTVASIYYNVWLRKNEVFESSLLIFRILSTTWISKIPSPTQISLISSLD